MIWDKYRGIINGLAHDLFFQEEISWHRLIEGIDYQGENLTLGFTEIKLKCLIGYNDFRTWPMDRVSEAGSADNQNMYVMLNKKYLSDLGYLNENSYFAFSAQRDYFSLNGIEYEDSGDTDVAQAGADPLFTYIILKRKEYETGKKVHGGPQWD